MKTIAITVVVLLAVGLLIARGEGQATTAFRANTIGQVTVRGYAVPCDRELCELAAARICSDGRTFPDGTSIIDATWERSIGMICSARCSDPQNTLVVMRCSNNYSAIAEQECRRALARQAAGPSSVFGDDGDWMLPPECRVEPDGIQEGPDGFTVPW